MVLYDLSSSLYWGSLAELSAWIFGFLLFVSKASEMAAFWFFVLHILRAVFGLFILKKLPASHTIIANIQVSSGNKKVPFEDITKHVVKTGQDAFIKFKADLGKIFLIAYTGMTLVCLLIDIIAFFCQAARFNTDRSAFSDTSLLAMSGVFLCCDLYYIIWMVASAAKFPTYMQKLVLMGLVGIFTEATKSMHEACNKYEIKIQEEANASLKSASAKAPAKGAPSKAPAKGPKK